jgi:mono/diheme cytochrome c family protein
MTGKRAILALIPLTAFAGLLLTYGQSQKEIARTETPQNRAEHEKMLATGRKLFVARCAKCHNEGGDKPLESGPPLNERKLSDEAILRAVSGRLKNAAEEEKRAVTLFVASFMKRE